MTVGGVARHAGAPLATLDWLHERFERLSRWAVWIGGAALLLAAIMVFLDVVSRNIWGVTMSGSDEISGYVFAGATTWAYAYCLLHRSNIRIDALYNLFPQTVRAMLDIVGLIALLIFMGYFTTKAVDVFVESWTRGSVSVTTLTTPLWIPQIVWLTGLLFFIVTLVFVIIHAIAAFVVSGSGRVQQLAGAMSISEEMDEETKGIQEIGR